MQSTKFDLTINLKSAEALGLSACDAVDGSSGGSMIAPSGGEQKGNIAFVPLAMPIMCGPRAIATTLGMISLVKNSEFEFISFLAIAGAILATMLVTMLVTYLCLAHADKILGRIGPVGIEAVTRIVGFLVAAMGVGLIFHGVIEAFQNYGALTLH